MNLHTSPKAGSGKLALTTARSAYPSYTDSGWDVLEKIPENWDVIPLKYLSKRPITSGVGEPGEHTNREWPRYIRITDIKDPRELHDDTFVSLPPEKASQAPVEPGDLLLASAGSVGDSYLCGPDIGYACYAGYLVRVRPRDGVDPRYLSYWTQSDVYWTEIDQNVIQTTVKNFSATRYQNLHVPLPPAPQQEKVSDYLDVATRKIDRLIDKKELLIELLEERRTALITKAVTKGLDPDAPMKDAGVEWLGKVPEHWEQTKLRHLASVQRGASPRPIDDQKYFDPDGQYGWVRIRDVTNSGMYLRETEQTLSELGKSKSVPLKPGRVILSIAATVGKPIITDTHCCIHDGFVYFQQLSLEPEFLYFIFHCQGIYSGLGKLGTQLNLNTDTVGDIAVPVPPKSEQKRISAYLRRQVRHHEKMEAKLREAISTLHEYRSALITAAVTGKIDVRDRAA